MTITFTIGIIYFPPFTNTAHDILSFGIFRTCIKYITRYHQWYACFFGKCYELGIDIYLSFECGMILQFKKKIIFPKNIFVFQCNSFGFVYFTCTEQTWNFTFDSGRKSNNILRIFFERDFIEAWFAIECTSQMPF